MSQSASPPSTGSPSLHERSLISFKWSALGELLSRSLQPLLVLVVGAFVTPKEFGLLAIATIALGVAQTLQDLGLSKALVQMDGDIDGVSDNVFWVNLVASVVLYLAILVGAPLMGAFFDAPDSVSVLRVLCVRLIILALGAVPLGRLQRELNFRSIFIGRLLGALTSTAVIIPSAYAGHGVWSLVWGMLVGSVVQTACLWKLTNWRPRFHWDAPLFRRTFQFSQWILAESVLATIINWGDSVVVGRFLGADGLGKYRMGANAIGLIVGIILAPLMPVAFSLFSRLQSDRSASRGAYLRLTRAAFIIALPVGIGIALTAHSMVMALLGPKWEGTEIVLIALGLKLGFDWLVGLNSVAYTALGRPDFNVKLLTVVCLFSLPAFAISAQYGLLAFCLTRLGASILDDTLNLIIGLRILRMRLREFAAVLWPAVPASLIMAAVVALLGWMLERRPIVEFAAQITAGAAAYAGFIAWREPQLLRRWFQSLR